HHLSPFSPCAAIERGDLAHTHTHTHTHAAFVCLLLSSNGVVNAAAAPSNCNLQFAVLRFLFFLFAGAAACTTTTDPCCGACGANTRNDGLTTNSQSEIIEIRRATVACYLSFCYRGRATDGPGSVSSSSSSSLPGRGGNSLGDECSLSLSLSLFSLS